MATNKVVFGGETVIDLTTDTLVCSDQLKKGIVAHTKDGNVVTGTLSPISNGKITIDSELNDDGTQTIIINESLKNNALALAINENDEPYFKGLGYQIGKRLGSDGSESDQGDCFVTGFIPFTAGMTMELENILLAADDTVDGYDYKYRISVYNNSKTSLATKSAKELLSYSENTVTVDGSYITQFTLNKISSSIDISNMAYIRISGILSGNPAIYLLDYVYTNILELAEYKNGNPYNNGIGYKENYIHKGSSIEIEKDGWICTGYIPLQKGDNIILKNINFPASSEEHVEGMNIFLYKSDRINAKYMALSRFASCVDNELKVENNKVVEFTFNALPNGSTDVDVYQYFVITTTMEENQQPPEIYRKELEYVY